MYFKIQTKVYFFPHTPNRRISSVPVGIYQFCLAGVCQDLRRQRHSRERYSSTQPNTKISGEREEAKYRGTVGSAKANFSSRCGAQPIYADDEALPNKTRIALLNSANAVDNHFPKFELLAHGARAKTEAATSLLATADMRMATHRILFLTREAP